MFREGIRSCLQREPDLSVVGEAASGEEVLELIPRVNPSILILDIRLADSSGIEVARKVRQQYPELKILVLTGYDFDQYVRAMTRVGIAGYLLKDAPQETLIQALREIAAGGAVLPPSIASKVIRQFSETPSDIGTRRPDDLTIR